MGASLDLSRWREAPRGVGYRRRVIVAHGLGRMLRGRFFRALLVLAWGGALLLAAAGFLLSQSVADGGLLDRLLGNFGPRGAAVAASLRALVLLYPDICFGGIFTTAFWLQSFVGGLLSLIALTAIVPGLIARDRASNALTVYLSRPLTSGDYLAGKLGTIAGTLLLLWTGPLVMQWLLSVVCGGDRDFFRYSLAPFAHALTYNAIALVALAAIAMGVSAVTRSSRTAILLWLGLWLVGGFVAAVPRMPLWIRRASFSRDLEEIRRETFRLDEALAAAGETLPLTNRRLADGLIEAGRHTVPADLGGALAGLLVMSVASGVVCLRRLKPE